jgi:hypothetical protein
MAMDHVDYGMDYESMEVMMENPHEIAEKQILDRDFFNGMWCCFARPALLDQRALACRPCRTHHILPPFWGIAIRWALACSVRRPFQ